MSGGANTNRAALWSVTWLLLVVGLLVGVWALRTRAPAAGELQSHTLAVEDIDILMMGELQRIGPALFLADPKPDTLPKSSWRGDEKIILFHSDLDLDDAELEALNVHTPAHMRIETWNGQAVGLAAGGRDLLSVQAFRDRQTRKQQLRFAASAACLLGSITAAALAWRRRKTRMTAAPATPTPSQFHQPGEPQ
jgi:hypothetical protein